MIVSPFWAIWFTISPKTRRAMHVRFIRNYFNINRWKILLPHWSLLMAVLLLGLDLGKKFTYNRVDFKTKTWLTFSKNRIENRLPKVAIVFGWKWWRFYARTVIVGDRSCDRNVPRQDRFHYNFSLSGLLFTFVKSCH